MPAAEAASTAPTRLLPFRASQRSAGGLIGAAQSISVPKSSLPRPVSIFRPPHLSEERVVARCGEACKVAERTSCSSPWYWSHRHSAEVGVTKACRVWRRRHFPRKGVGTCSVMRPQGPKNELLVPLEFDRAAQRKEGVACAGRGGVPGFVPRAECFRLRCSLSQHTRRRMSCNSQYR